jgi:hypothetical protein
MAWPLDKVTAKLAAAGPGVPTAVLVSTGAMNPVHRGHVEVLSRARRGVEAATSMQVSHRRHCHSTLSSTVIAEGFTQ